MIAIDTETTMAKPGEIPELICLSWWSGSSGGVIQGDDSIYDFLCRIVNDDLLYPFVFHNASFDLHVIHKFLTEYYLVLTPKKPLLLYEISPTIEYFIERSYDTGILYRLLNLAKHGEVLKAFKGGPEAKARQQYNLKALVYKYLGIEISKELQTSFTVGEELTPEQREYALLDAKYTYELFYALKSEIESKGYWRGLKTLSQDIQLLGEYALAEVSRNGMCIDPVFLNDKIKEYEALEVENLEVLAQYGWEPGTGSTARYNEIVLELGCEDKIKKTPKSGKYKAGVDDVSHLRSIPFFDALVEYKHCHKMLQTYLRGCIGEEKIHTQYNCILKTGRTSSRKPNMQNLPRKGDIRDIFVPRAEHVFIACDYSAIELCTLAQTCIDKYGKSVMGDLINQGKDLHRWFASKINNKSEDAVTDSERQKAKACNFGFPGGMGVETFVSLQAASGLHFTISEATELKKLWLSSFPEMKQYMFSRAQKETVVTKTGRVRANCTYCQARNLPFQSLAADGMKLALYDLISNGFSVVNMIHDEVIVEVCANLDLREVAEAIATIMVAAMKRLTPDVVIKCEYAAMRRWQKGAKPVFGAGGQLLIWEKGE